MSSRHSILAAVRKNFPRPAVPLPELADLGGRQVVSGLGWKEHFTSLPQVQHSGVDTELLSSFQKQLEAMGGRWLAVADATGVRIPSLSANSLPNDRLHDPPQMELS